MHMRLMTSISAIALFGALGSAQAATVAPMFGECPDISSTPGRSSAVLSSVAAGAVNTYDFKVCNTSNSGEGETQFLLRDWEMPYDPLADITGLRAPAGWGVKIETIGTPNPNTGWDGATPDWFNPLDPFFDARYLGLTEVIHFYTCASTSLTEGNTCYGGDADDLGGPILSPGDSLEGFGFSSRFGATNAPYQASWVLLPPRSGDPAFPGAAGPNSPGLRNSVPEPAGLALFALGLGAAMTARARRQGRKPD